MKNKGLAIKPFIFIRDKSDRCLISHELVHLKQQKYWFNVVWFWKWLFDIEFRKQVEKEAMIVQLTCMRHTLNYLNKDYFRGFMKDAYKMSDSEIDEIFKQVT